MNVNSIPAAVTDITSLLLDFMTDGVCAVDVEGQVNYANAACARLMAYDQPDELLAKKVLITAFDQDGCCLTHPECWESRDGRGYDIGYFRRSDGSDIRISYCALPIRESGDIVGAILVLNGESEYSLADEKLMEFLESAPDAMIVVKSSGDIHLVNTNVETVFGYSREELVGQPIEALLPIRFRDKHREHRECFTKTTHSRAMGNGVTLFGSRKDRTEIPLEISLNPLDTDGEQTIICAVREVSERYQLEAQLRQSQKMEAVGQLSGGIAHDFNNLLNIIIGNLQLLEEPVKRHDDIYYIREALEGATRAADLTRRLLVFSRRQLLAPKVININDLVNKIQPLLIGSLHKDIAISTELASDLWLAEIDPSQLENALVNLAINARDAMSGGGALVIKTANITLDRSYTDIYADLSPGDYVVVTVEDNGAGIPSEAIPHVFEPFYTTKNSDKGTGLGLSMVYGFVKQSKGHIDLYSEDGLGTCIRIYLPRAHSSRQNSDATSTSLSGIPGGSETILIVEDEPGARKVAVALLSALGYRVLEADSAATALTLLEEFTTVDLLFTDIVMPGGMSGVNLAHAALQRKSNLKILYTSGFTETGTFERGFLDSDDFMLNKPYLKHQLAQKVREVLDYE